MADSAQELLDRAQRPLKELCPDGDCVEIHSDHGRLIVQTGGKTVRRARVRAVVSGVAAAAAGIALFSVSPWFLSLVPVGFLYAGIAPRRINPLPIATVEVETGCLIAANAVPLQAVKGISGSFETKGWDGFSTIHAVLDGGSTVHLAMLLGANETLARSVCAVFGAIANCPADYSGPSGDSVPCYRPAVL